MSLARLTVKSKVPHGKQPSREATRFWQLKRATDLEVTTGVGKTDVIGL
jgi:hypothetical protein